MVAPKPFISDRAASKIAQLKRRGHATTQLTMDPEARVTIRRRTADGTTVIADNVKPIRIALDDREERRTAGTEGVIEVATTGEIRLWEADVTSLPQEGDGFSWQDQPCRIVGAVIVRNGAIRATYEVMVSNR